MTVIFIPTASVIGDQPSEWLKLRLDTAIKYYQDHIAENCPFVVAGRWNNVIDSYELTEAEVCKRYIISKLPDATVIKEDIAVETGGGFAFAKPLIAHFNPNKVVIFNSQVFANRCRYFAQKIFDPKWTKEFIFVEDVLCQNPRAIRKEPKALAMFKKLFDRLVDGDDQSAREILLYHTPYYFKGIINDKNFFDFYWPGGFEDFLEKRLSINNK